MKQLFALLLILLVPFVAAEFVFDHSLYSAQSVTLDVTVENTISVSGNVQEVHARLYYHPKDYATQTVRNVRNNPQPTQEIDHLLFSWRNPQGALSFSHQSTVTSDYHQPRITQEIAFPYEFVPAEMSRYLRSEEIIRITPAIRRQAEEIIGDEQDAVRVAFLLGSWVKENIEYDLSSVAVQASYPSDWVLENREGVCDELTSLFIAMLRSQGIPARFVSGVAYTNLEILDTNWGPHGWAEVWFPEVGWVPYDVTYGQYGFVDATHIAIQKTPDAAANAAEYSMRSRGGDFDPQPLVRDFVLTNRGAERPADIDITLRPAIEHTGFGSYNRIDVDVRNLRNYYVSADLHFGQTNRMTSERDTTSILLGPNERKTLHWYVKVDEDLEQGFQYTFPAIVTSNLGERADTEFRTTQQGIVAQREDVAIEITQSPRGLSPDIRCEYPETVSQSEPFRVTCTYPETVQLCLKECVEGTSITQTFSFERLGAHTTTVSATRGLASTQKVLTFIVVDEPALTITANATNPVSYLDEALLTITLEKTSVTDPQDVTITLEHPLFYEEFSLERLQSRHTLEVRLPANQLTKQNTFTLTASYEAYETTVNQTTTADIEVLTQGIGQRMSLATNRFFGWLARIF